MSPDTEKQQEGKDSRSVKTARVLTAVVIIAVPAALLIGRDVIPPVRFLLWHFVSLAWFCVILAAAWGQGRALAGVFVREGSNPSPFPSTVLALGLGLGLFSLETLLLGAAGYLTTPSLTLLVLMVFLFTAAGARRGWPEIRNEYRATRRFPAGSGLPLSLTGLGILVSWPFVLVPTRAFDALSYHLEIPLRYLQAGRVLDIPENLYSYTPQLNHMLYGLALGLSGADLAGLINHLFFVLTMAVLWLGFRELFGPSGGAWAAALAALSPLMLLEAANPGVDWAAAFYTLAALSILTARADDRGMVLLAGVLAGMAAGCRHQPLAFAIVLPLAAGLLDDLMSKRRGRIRNWALFAGVAVLVASPWYLRNWIFTGDPLFPLLANLAGKTGAGAGFVAGVVGPKSIALLWQWAVLPFRMVFDPLSYSMTATVGVQYLVLLPLLGLRGRNITRSRFLLLWLFLAFLAWYLNFQTARYAMPIIMVAGLWLGAALAAAAGKRTGLTPVLKITVAAALLVNAGVFIGLQDYTNRSVGASLGTRSSFTYLMETYEPYPAIDYLNRLDPPPGKVLFVGEMRGFYSRFSREVASHNAPNRLLEWIKRGLPHGAVIQELSGAGFTHLLVNRSEWQRMAYRNLNAPSWVLSPEQQARLGDFLNTSTERVFSSGRVTVYSLCPEKNEGGNR